MLDSFVTSFKDELKPKTLTQAEVAKIAGITRQSVSGAIKGKNVVAIKGRRYRVIRAGRDHPVLEEYAADPSNDSDMSKPGYVARLHEMSLDELKAEKLAIEIEDRLRDRERHDVEIMEATEARVEAAFTKAVGRLVEWIRDNLPAEFVEKFGAALQAMKKELKNAVEIQEASSSGEDAASGE